MKKMSYILTVGFLCCILGGALCVLGYVRGGMEYVKAADALPRHVVKRMETAFSDKGKMKGGDSAKGGSLSVGAEEKGDSGASSFSAAMEENGGGEDNSSSAAMEENGDGGDGSSSTAIEENGSSGDAVLKTGKDGKKYTFQVSKKKLQGFDTIQGDLKHVDMKIVSSGSKEAYIEYKLTAKKNSNPFRYQVKNSTLTLSEKDGMYNSYYQFVRAGKVVEQRNTNLVTLYLPKKQLKNMAFTLGEGDLIIKDLDTKKAELTLREGDLWLEASTIKGGDMESKDGDFIIDQAVCENCKFSAGNGDFDCSDFKVKKSGFTAMNGDFTFDRSTSENCQFSAENGDFDCSSFTAQNSTLSAENGDIYLQKATVTSCSIYAECGDITVEDATVSGKGISSDVGDVYFLRSTVKNCKVSTDTGDIDGDQLKVSGNVTLIGEDGDIWIALEASCKTKVNIQAHTEDGSMEKSGKFKGKVKKSGGSRIYRRDTGSKDLLKIITEDGDISLE